MEHGRHQKTPRRQNRIESRVNESGTTCSFCRSGWGESYVRTFLDYCLPAQLSPENISSLSKDGGDRYIIYTTPADQAVIEASESCCALQRLLRVTFEHIDLTLFDGEKYQCKSECYRKALQQAITRNAAVIALNADVLFANGFLRSVKNLLSRGNAL